MQKESFIRRVDNPTNQFRFYQGVWQNPETQKEEVIWCYPSVTSKIDAVYPKDTYLIKWIRENGLSGQAEFERAGEEGTEIHILIDRLIKKESLPTFDMSEKVKRCLLSFIDWYQTFKPKIIETETMVVDHELRVAGTFDLKCELNVTVGKETYKGVYLIDYKTSRSVHESHKIQNCTYAKIEGVKNASLLHLGNSTKKHWSFIDIEPEEVIEYQKQFDHFNKTFDILHPNAAPNAIVYPEVFTLSI